MQYSRLLAFVFLAVSNLHGASAASLMGAELEARQTSGRTTPLLKNFVGQPPLPTLAQVQSANASGNALNLANIQADILVGMKKPVETFAFFKITNPAAFKKTMRTMVVPLITSAATLISPPAKQPAAYVNVAFSQSGLTALNVTDSLGDQSFTEGQFADAASLKDDTSKWQSQFKGTDIHGVFLVGSDVGTNIVKTFAPIIQALSNSASLVYELQGAARPGAEAGHEHFGYLDGISNPGLTGFTTNPFPGQSVVDPGIILLGETGDSVARPAWAKDGSFLAFRKLQQLVPEYKKYLLDNSVEDQARNLTKQQGADLLGARIVGRWPSGAPVDLSPLHDDTALGADFNRNNNFDFTHPEIPGFDFTSGQTRCPFTAHIRKARPRADLSNANTVNQAIRAGIPYGPEVSASEAASNTTATDRGLAFVMYQSQINQGFRFQQETWVNNAGFIFNKNITTPGLDLLIGQAGNNAPRTTTGMDPNDADRTFTMQEVVVSNGGEYFFSPSISALNSTILA